MRKRLSRLQRVLVYGLLFMGLLMAGGYLLYHHYLVDRAMAREDRVRLFLAINTSPELPPLFYTTYDKYFDHALEKRTNLLAEWFAGRADHCPCRQIYVHPGMGLKPMRGAQSIVLWEMERHCSQRKCLDYYMHSDELPHHLNSLEEASEFYYHKPPQELDETECLGLILISLYPRYDPLRYPGKLDEEIAKRKATLH